MILPNDSSMLHLSVHIPEERDTIGVLIWCMLWLNILALSLEQKFYVSLEELFYLNRYTINRR